MLRVLWLPSLAAMDGLEISFSLPHRHSSDIISGVLTAGACGQPYPPRRLH